MAFARGKFGIEYNTAPRREEPGPFVPIVLALVFAVVLGSLVWTVYGRLKGDSVERAQVEEAREEDLRKAAEAAKSAAKEAEKSVSLEGVSDVAAPKKSDPAPQAPSAVKERPVQVRNLLTRLDVAKDRHDVEMAATTIEQLRALPGKPAADLDDALARRLGKLNVQRLFTMRSPLWVVETTVGRGESASLIASQHGSTFRSMQKLNPRVDLGRLRVGQKLKVMNHPSFRLLVSRSTKTADLMLNGKFFKRYYLAGPVTGAVGGYELPANTGSFWTSIGVSLSKDDRAELGVLLPKGTSVILSDL